MLDLESAIRNRAYEIWQAEGQVHGRDVTHWLRAEEEIKGVAGAVPPGSKPQRAARKSPGRPAAEKPKTAARRPAKSGTSG